jgi:hypothetical protein
VPEIARVGIKPRAGVVDFDHDVRTVTFHGRCAHACGMAARDGILKSTKGSSSRLCSK